MNLRMISASAACVCGVFVSLALSANALAAPTPFGHDCTAQNGVRFCPTSTLTERVPSWDGLPIDADVTLPTTGNGPWPLVVMLHGFGGSKATFEATNARGVLNAAGELITSTYHYNNIYFAQRGYAVVNYSHRGFGNSCGVVESRTSPECDRGWFHMADQRYEIRDAQTMIGKLVDGGIAQRGAIGVTGFSWGGGQSLQLGWLKNRVRTTDGKLVPWRSPKGHPLSIRAAWPRGEWSNLAWSLVPTGYFSDTAKGVAAEKAAPVGTPLGALAETKVLSLLLDADYAAPEGADPQVDPIGWSKLFAAGEPYGSVIRDVVSNLSRYSSITDLSGSPAPLLLQNGFADELFPPREALRAYNIARSRNPKAQVALQFGDLGHPRGSNKLNTFTQFNAQGSAFFDYWLRGRGKPLAPGSVSVMTQTCPAPTQKPPPAVVPPAGGPYRASSWRALSPGAVRASSAAKQTVLSADSDAALGSQFTFILGTTDACLTVPKTTSAGAAYYTVDAKRPFTLLGLPAIRATVAVKGTYAQLAARLWDIDPDGQQRLISRGVRRLTANQEGTIHWLLSGNGYRVQSGHQVRLELLGSDFTAKTPFQVPMYRPSNGSFSVDVSKLSLVLPTRERSAGVAGASSSRLLDR